MIKKILISILFIGFTSALTSAELSLNHSLKDKNTDITYPSSTPTPILNEILSLTFWNTPGNYITEANNLRSVSRAFNHSIKEMIGTLNEKQINTIMSSYTDTAEQQKTNALTLAKFSIIYNAPALFKALYKANSSACMDKILCLIPHIEMEADPHSSLPRIVKNIKGFLTDNLTKDDKNKLLYYYVTKIKDPYFQESILDKLLIIGAEINPTYTWPKYNDVAHTTTLLHTITEHWKLNKLRMLLKKGASANAKTHYGQTPLHLALIHGSFSSDGRETILLLLEHGADPHAQNNDGESPFDYFIHNDALYTIPTICEEKIKTFAKIINKAIACNPHIVNQPDSKYIKTPLYRVIEKRRRTQLAEILIKNPQININEKSINGLTPLHCAIHNCRIGLINLLIDHGADINMQDNDGNTPLHSAVADLAVYPYKNYAGIIALLLQKGANPLLKNHRNENCWNALSSLQDDILNSVFGKYPIVKQAFKTHSSIDTITK